MTDRLRETHIFDPASLQQTWPSPSAPRPVVTFGAGSIVGDAHFPAYRKSGVPIAGLYDPDLAKAEKLAQAWGVTAFRTVEEAVSVKDAVFDLATPPEFHAAVLRALPDGAPMLIQKPMGRDLGEATEILAICREKQLVAAVNFQLRFAPMMLALKDAIARGWLGEVVDFDASLALDTPWQLWEFLLKAPRVELALHSIHYLDLVRQLLGDPLGVHAKSLGHPNHTIAQTRTSAILDYGDRVRCALSINHDHKFGRRHQACEFRICGTEGAAYLQLGVNLDYPRGEPDILEIFPKGGSEWITVPLEGAWFPDAFVGRMANLQRFLAGEDAELVSSVEDAWNTMALIEAAYQSSASPATPLARPPDGRARGDHQRRRS
jgi:predicted dehydrogenase